MFPLYCRAKRDVCLVCLAISNMKYMQYWTVLFIVFPGQSHGVEWDTLLVNYPKFTSYPVTVSEAKTQQWSLVSADTSLNVDVYWKGSDFTYMVLFDKNGFLAGLRIGVPVAGIDSQAKTNKVTFGYNYDNNKLFSKQKKNNVYPEDFWYTDILFQSPSNLKKNGRTSLVRGKDEVALGVFSRLNGQWTELSRLESGILKQGFVKHKCFAGMGQHYFYGVDSKADCKKMQGVFAAYEGGKLVMTGVFGFGVISRQPNQFEVVKQTVAELIFLDQRPACLDTDLKNVGAFSTHVYLVSRAAKLTCPASG